MAKAKRKTKKSTKKRPARKAAATRGATAARIVAAFKEAKRAAKKSPAKKATKGRRTPNWDRCLVCHHPVMGSRKGMDTHMSKHHPGAQYGAF